MITVDHPLFQQIKTEHSNIKTLLEFKPSNDEEKCQWLESIRVEVEESHHKKEEILFFSKIHDHPQLCESGPLCSYYFDPFMMNSPIEWAKKNTNTIPTIESWQSAFYDLKGPIIIPVDEHRAGKTILNFLITHQKTISEFEFTRLMKFYKELQYAHMEKEEHCFFFNACRLMTQTQADEIYTAWKKIS